MKSLKESSLPRDPKERRSFEARPLTSIILLHHKYLIDDHKADFDSNDSQIRKLKKHFKRLMTMPMRLFSPIPNPTMEFNKRAL